MNEWHSVRCTIHVSSYFLFGPDYAHLSNVVIGLPVCSSLSVLASVICLCAQGPGWEEGSWGIWGLHLHTQQLRLPSRFRAWAAGMCCCSHGAARFSLRLLLLGE